MIAHMLRYVFGIGFLMLGVAGLFLPVLQGILFLVVGMLILAPELRMIRRLIARIEKRFPRTFGRIRDRARTVCRRVIPWFGGREETCDSINMGEVHSGHGVGECPENAVSPHAEEDTVFTDEDGRADSRT